ncbi:MULTISPECIES: hypothetical protein [unclassified Sphingomonas]|uniref:hypothetical protein n=1 Tax=unclassified Sphingomonas TaxID=196159 RepID=UPI00138F5271|nr:MULTISPECIES: hypothetical protein [unclassified Sphingomonas]
MKLVLLNRDPVTMISSAEAPESADALSACAQPGAAFPIENIVSAIIDTAVLLANLVATSCSPLCIFSVMSKSPTAPKSGVVVVHDPSVLAPLMIFNVPRPFLGGRAGWRKVLDFNFPHGGSFRLSKHLHYEQIAPRIAPWMLK